MIRISTLIWTLLVLLSGYAMFQVKASVGRLDDRLAHINRQIGADREQIHELNVEMATLTQPQRLQLLSDQVLHLAPISTAVLGSLDQVPLRDDIAAAPPAAKPAAPPTHPGAELAEVAPKNRP